MAWDPVDAAKAQLARLQRTLRSIDVRDAKVATGAACVGLGLGMLMAGARDRRALRRLTAVVKTAEADADAARRTAARDVAEAKRFGAQKVAASFFGVADSLALARQSSADTAPGLVSALGTAGRRGSFTARLHDARPRRPRRGGRDEGCGGFFFFFLNCCEI